MKDGATRGWEEKVRGYQLWGDHKCIIQRAPAMDGILCGSFLKMVREKQSPEIKLEYGPMTYIEKES